MLPALLETLPSWCGCPDLRDLGSGSQNFTYTFLPLETESVEIQAVKIRLCPVKPSSHKSVFLAGSNLYIPIFGIHPNSEVTECL